MVADVVVAGLCANYGNCVVWMVVANKMDLEGAEENLQRFRQRFPKVEVVPISAELEEGIDPRRRILSIG